jgi:serine/threonine-protein kinase
VETITMQDLSDLTESVAKTTLKNNKLSVGKVKTDYSNTVEKGHVIFQSVLKDEKVEVGTTIDIVISLGPKEEKPIETPKPDEGNPSDDDLSNPSDKEENTDETNGTPASGESQPTNA